MNEHLISDTSNDLSSNWAENLIFLWGYSSLIFISVMFWEMLTIGRASESNNLKRVKQLTFALSGILGIWRSFFRLRLRIHFGHKFTVATSCSCQNQTRTKKREENENDQSTPVIKAKTQINKQI